MSNAAPTAATMPKLTCHSASRKRELERHRVAAAMQGAAPPFDVACLRDDHPQPEQRKADRRARDKSRGSRARVSAPAPVIRDDYFADLIHKCPELVDGDLAARAGDDLVLRVDEHEVRICGEAERLWRPSCRRRRR